MSFGVYGSVWEDICLEVSLSPSLGKYVSFLSAFEIMGINNHEITIFTNYYNIENLWSSKDIYTLSSKIRDIVDNPYITINFQGDRIKKLALNLSKTLAEYKVNSENRLALAVAKKICCKDAEDKYSPLYIYSKTGLGKSHLINAIAIEYKSVFPNKTVNYCSGELFLNSFFEAAKHDSLEQWKKYNTSCDLFILDDIQYLMNKESVIREFYSIFESLYNTNTKPQIIITSNKEPHWLEGFPDSLKSRLQWGVKLEILTPNDNTKDSIINNLIEKYKVEVEDNIKPYIVKHFNGNIRELEGLFKTIYTHNSLLKEKINTQLIDKLLGKENKSFEYSITGEDILYNVCKYFNIDESDIKSKNRSRKITFPRQVGIYITKNLTNLSLQEIGKIYGGRDHSTVKHSNDKMIRLYKTNNDTKIVINNIIKTINNKKVSK